MVGGPVRPAPHSADAALSLSGLAIWVMSAGEGASHRKQSGLTGSAGIADKADLQHEFQGP